MIDLSKITTFDWDQGNNDKSYKKHGLTPKEAEEIFLDENVFLVEDFKHSQKEERFIAIGQTKHHMHLFTVFSIRNNNIRIISVRIANKKERGLYEKTT